VPPKRGLRAEDLYSLQLVEDPQISPDGRHIAFVRASIDRTNNQYCRNIWLTRLRGRQPALTRQLTYAGKRDSSPRWSPDGQRLAFAASRGDKPQIHVIELAGGEARPVTNLRNGASNPVWSPDGQRLAFVGRVNQDERQQEDSGEKPEPPGTSLEARHRKEVEDEREKQKADPRIITRLPYRSGTEFFDDRRSHIYVVEVPADGLTFEDDVPSPPEARRLTDGELDFDQISWSADGRYIITTRARDPDYDPWFQHEVVRLPARGPRRPARVLSRLDGDYALPRVSPDGRWIAVLRRKQGGSLGRLWHVALIPAAGGRSRLLSEALDRNVEDIAWSHDSRWVYFTAGHRGDVGLYRVAVDGQSTQVEMVLGGSRSLTGFSLASAGQVAFTAWTPERSADLYLVRGPSESRLTDFNRKLLAEVTVVVPEEVRYPAHDGAPNVGEIQGWLYKPRGASAQKKAPLVVHVHGGPHIMWGPAFPGMWLEWQFHLARGYAVFYCNPRGAQGYGEAFSESIQGDWGDHVMRDILAGVDLAAARSFVDETRLALTGGSYAGYMTAWIVGHDNRFACAWAQRGLYNLLSFFGTTDIPQLIEREFEMYPFDDVAAAWRQSPLAYVRNIQTPLAIEHQDQDYRCPVSEAEQLYSALKRLKRKVVFVRYPREGHEMSRSGEPRHRVDRLNRMVAWFDEHCR
jgi:dipeptidyl aminopeptidase/acylaminoacyl peptidase